MSRCSSLRYRGNATTAASYPCQASQLTGWPQDIEANAASKAASVASTSASGTGNGRLPATASAKASSSAASVSIAAYVTVCGFAPDLRITIVTSSSTSAEPLEPNT